MNTKNLLTSAWAFVTATGVLALIGIVGGIESMLVFGAIHRISALLSLALTLATLAHQMTCAVVRRAYPQ